MPEYVLCFKPAIGLYGSHDPSAVLFRNSRIQFGVEEERFTREKHARNAFPSNAIEACLSHADIGLENIDKIILPYKPSLANKNLSHDFKRIFASDSGLILKIADLIDEMKTVTRNKFMPDFSVRSRLEEIGSSVPPIAHKSHHRCHAASAFYPTDMEEALVITADGAGEYDSTVIWQADESGLTRISTHPSYNSLGRFFGSVTEYLGYHANNGEGKVMGLAPYGSENTEIRERLYSVASFGVDYDVTAITAQGIQNGAKKLEDVLGRPQRSSIDGFDDFEKDLAYTAQRLVEETIVDITTAYVRRLGVKNVCLAGGVALNCKMNKKVMEINEVDNFFVQPVAHDAGLALGAGWLESEPSTVQPMTNVYWGPSWDQRAIQDTLDEAKISYKNEEDVPKHVAREIASGRLVGWFQGRQEMGPRALGNRSILADPRTKESRDRVNKFVKHREEWRPFAPSILEGKADEYLQSYTQSPYMIKTFDTHPEIQDQIRAVVHPSDNTTRPQTVNESQNPKYYEMITEFENITDVPAVLNTSFNDHAEPIVTTPSEAIRDFYSMGLDTLAIGDFIIEK